MRETIAKAVNAVDVDLMAPLLSEKVSITMVDQSVITSPKELKDYFRKMFQAEGALLKSVHIDPSADMETVFLNDSLGINRGSSTDSYTLKSGREVVFHTRWTSTVIKDGGKWKLLTLHVGVNFLDNPVLTATGQMKYWWGAGGAVAGLLLALVMRRCCRRPSAS